MADEPVQLATDASITRPGDLKAPPSDLPDVHRLAMREYGRADAAERDNRTEQLDDLKFRAGEQWLDVDKAMRTADGRPVMTVNRIPQFIRQVTGDARENKIAVKVRPVGSGATSDIADIYTGLIRHIEMTSDADTAYITGLDHSATGGLGHFRISTQYATDDSFDQDIRIIRMPDPFAVLWDPLAKEIDKTDANFAFVTERLSRDVFQERYPDAMVVDWKSETYVGTMVGATNLANWYDEYTVRIAEYWTKRPIETMLYLLEGGQVVKEVPAGATVVRSRKVRQYQVVQYIMSGSEVLEGPYNWPGQFIPLIPVVGEEVFIGDRVVRHGITRFMKDPQRLFNYMRSSSAEVTALQPKSPWLVTQAMITGREAVWQQAGKKNYPYLIYNFDPKVPGGKPEKIQPPTESSGLVAEATLASDDMKAVSGIYDAELGNRGNETSGRAIIARQRQGDTGTFVYIDNLSKAIACCGRQLIDLIPHVYDTERVIRVLGEDGTEGTHVVNKAIIARDGKTVMLNDLTIGKYDLVVQTGPSYATKRLEAADSMLQFVGAVPQSAALIGDLIASNMDWPGAEQIAERLKAALPPGIDKDKPMPQPPPPPIGDVAKAMLLGEQAKGVSLDNLQKELALEHFLGAAQAIPQIQQQLAQLIAQGMGGPQGSQNGTQAPATGGIPPGNASPAPAGANGVM